MPIDRTNRRTFMAALGGAAAWPVVARAQQPERTRRIGILMAQAEGDQEAIDREAAIREGLQKLGWVEGRNIQIDTRLAGGSAERLQAHAAVLAQLGPDVIIASATSALDALQKATRTIPIVFAQVTDPVGAGFVAT